MRTIVCGIHIFTTFLSLVRSRLQSATPSARPTTGALVLKEPSHRSTVRERLSIMMMIEFPDVMKNNVIVLKR